MAQAFNDSKYLITRKFFELLGQQYRITDSQGQVVSRVKMKAFKLKEDIRFFEDEAMTRETLVIKARRIVDFGAAYDVFDSASGQRLGTLRRKGLKSMVRDEWAIMNFDDQEIGVIEEDSWMMALVRRFLFSLIPQRYNARVNGKPVATFIRHLSFFIMKMTVEVVPGMSATVDPRLLLASGLLLCAVEGRQG